MTPFSLIYIYTYMRNIYIREYNMSFFLSPFFLSIFFWLFASFIYFSLKICFNFLLLIYEIINNIGASLVEIACCIFRVKRHRPMPFSMRRRPIKHIVLFLSLPLSSFFPISLPKKVFFMHNNYVQTLVKRVRYDNCPFNWSFPEQRS